VDLSVHPKSCIWPRYAGEVLSASRGTSNLLVRAASCRIKLSLPRPGERPHQVIERGALDGRKHYGGRHSRVGHEGNVRVRCCHKGSPMARRAASKLTPCLAKFRAAFSSSHHARPCPVSPDHVRPKLLKRAVKMALFCAYTILS
jgi:hypothetical protein